MVRRYKQVTETLPRPSQTETAPHRFTWDREPDDGSFSVIDGNLVPSIREFLAQSPYKVGDVVYVARDRKEARRAYISRVGHEYDQYGDRRFKYRVHLENKCGDAFSANFIYTWPGMIQRGYLLAGLAPDLEGKV